MDIEESSHHIDQNEPAQSMGQTTLSHHSPSVQHSTILPQEDHSVVHLTNLPITAKVSSGSNIMPQEIFSETVLQDVPDAALTPTGSVVSPLRPDSLTSLTLLQHADPPADPPADPHADPPTPVSVISPQEFSPQLTKAPQSSHCRSHGTMSFDGNRNNNPCEPNEPSDSEVDITGKYICTSYNHLTVIKMMRTFHKL